MPARADECLPQRVIRAAAGGIIPLKAAVPEEVPVNQKSNNDLSVSCF